MITDLIVGITSAARQHNQDLKNRRRDNTLLKYTLVFILLHK